MQTQQTQFIGLGGAFSSTAFFKSAAGGGTIPADGPFTVMAMIIPTAVSEPASNEWIFGNITAGGTGFGIQRSNPAADVYRITGRFGIGGAEVSLGIDVPAAAVAGHTLFVHFVYNGSGGYASYLNGQLIEVKNDDPFVSDPSALTLGYAATYDPYSGLIIAVGLAYSAFTAYAVFAQVAEAMKLHDIKTGVPIEHIWSAQMDALRDAPIVLTDHGTGTALPLGLGSTGTPHRSLYDVQYSLPLAQPFVPPPPIG